MKHYEKNVAKVIEVMESYGYSAKSVHIAKKCFKALHDEMAECRIHDFSVEYALDWCDKEQSEDKRRRYRDSILRLADIYENGHISSTHLRVRQHLTGWFPDRVNEYICSLTGLVHKSLKHVKRVCLRFCAFIRDKGVSSIEQVSYDILEEYDGFFYGSDTSRSRCEDIVSAFFRFLSDQGLCSHGYSLFLHYVSAGKCTSFADLSNDAITSIELCRKESQIFPAAEFLETFADFESQLTAAGYKKVRSTFFLKILYIFLDREGLGYHRAIVENWFNQVGERVFGKSMLCARRIYDMYDDYANTGGIVTTHYWKHGSILFDHLPEWCKSTVESFTNQKIKEEWKDNTIDSYRRSITRFCLFVTSQGVSSFNDISPEIVKQFNLQDLHGSVRSKNSCNTHIRYFLLFLERGGQTRPGLHFALSSKTAQNEKIVKTLTEDDKRRIQEYSKNASSPIELRDAAILHIGMDMGFRESDIVAIKISDIDWKNKVIRIKQRKTGVLHCHPMDVATGNAIFKYIKNGRRNIKGEDYVFLHSRAPYTPIGRDACRGALRRAGVSTTAFHRLRKTYASEVLNSGSTVSETAEMLGHSNSSTVHVYTSLDADRMGLCPLSMSETGLSYEKEMMVSNGSSFLSAIAEWIVAFIEEKHSLGYKYYTETRLMKEFDTYWIQHGYKKEGITRDNITDWMNQKAGEGSRNRKARITVVRQFSIFLNGLGIPSYLPEQKVRCPKPMVYVLSRDEIIELFREIDSYVPGVSTVAINRIANEYPVLFRLLYLNGLRIGEACELATDCVNLENGTITIMDGKGNKDRIVYLSDDMSLLLRRYFAYLEAELGHVPKWAFPGWDPDEPLEGTSVRDVFGSCWSHTSFADKCEKKPTVHCLRHSFVVERIERWRAQGLDFEQMLPYLSQYLGHKSFNDTYYYYHYVEETARTIRIKDKTIDRVIPEVIRR